MVPDLERRISLKASDIALLTGDFPYAVDRNVLPEEIRLPERLSPRDCPPRFWNDAPDIRKAER